MNNLTVNMTMVFVKLSKAPKTPKILIQLFQI